MKNIKDKEIDWPKTKYCVKAVRERDKKIIEIPVLPINMLVTGTTGFGKTVFIKQYISRMLEENPEKYIIIFQIKPEDYTKDFLRPQDVLVY